jgi:hypothetical protein
VVAYVYRATPISLGQTGVRGFGGDSSGVLCFSTNGAAPATTGSISLSINTTDCQVLQ